MGDTFDPADNAVPDALNPGNEVMAWTEQQAGATVRLDLVRQHGKWTINGHTWDDVVRSGLELVEASATRGDTTPPFARARLQDPGPQRRPAHGSRAGT